MAKELHKYLTKKAHGSFFDRLRKRLEERPIDFRLLNKLVLIKIVGENSPK